jgi:hypothetical protein
VALPGKRESDDETGTNLVRGGRGLALADARDGHTRLLLCDPAAAEPRALPLEADWVVDDFALFVLQLLPGCISRTSVHTSAHGWCCALLCVLLTHSHTHARMQEAILDVWQGLVERVAHLHAQEPESKARPKLCPH